MVVAALVGGVIALSSLFLILRGLYHHAPESTLVASPVKPLLVGVLAAGVCFGLFAGLGAIGVPPLVVIALIVASSASLAVLFGLAPVMTVVEERVLALRELRVSPFVRTSVGTVVLVITVAVTVLGWFVIDRIAVLLGLGSGGAERHSLGSASGYAAVHLLDRQVRRPGCSQSPSVAESDSSGPVLHYRPIL